ncbi:hypothetical protein ACHAQA_004356 [Verticillium albo-atrum]
MQAWQYTDIKGTLEDSLVLNEKAIPPDAASLPEDHVLIEVIAAGINPVDYKLIEIPVFGKFMTQPPASPGLDFCGRIRTKKASNTIFSEGQLVFGALSITTKVPKFGALSQLIIAPCSQLAALPKGVAPDDAAAVGTAGLTAYQSLPQDLIKPGSKIFINGGSGGVGSFAIQFAKALRAHVTTTSSTENLQLCRELGADEVIDYRKVDVVEVLRKKGQVFDLAIDNVGTPAGLYEASKNFLKLDGTFVQVAMQPMTTTFRRNLLPACFGPKRSYHVVRVKVNRENLERIGRWIAEGRVRVLVDEKFQWVDAPKAYEKLRRGHTTGKLIVEVSNSYGGAGIP